VSGAPPPLVSVVVPVYNGEAFLAEAIASLLAQRHPALEIVAVDDGSTDGSAKVLRRFGDAVCYHAHEHAGVAAARNAGLQRARGELIGFLDQDDLWAEDKLAVLLPLFAADERLDAAYGLTRCVGVGARAGAPPQFDMHLGSALFRRSLLARLGGLDETVRYFADDIDLFLRLRERKARVAYVDRVTLTYRLHGANASLNMSSPPRIFLVEVLKRSLDRRRRAHDMSVSPLPEFIRALTVRPRTEGHGE
jgi:glycosyltransferase involved in cell wall biosynthesis